MKRSFYRIYFTSRFQDFCAILNSNLQQPTNGFYMILARVKSSKGLLDHKW